MNKIYLLIIVILLSCQTIALSQNSTAAPVSEPTEPAEVSPIFIDLWNNAAYYGTNLERQRFSSLLGRYEGKVGFNFFHYPLQLYGVYYGASSQTSNYWNNYIFSGSGVRLSPFRDYQGTSWANEWLKGVKLYAENLSANYLKDAASAESLAKEDRRYGLEIWYAWNQDQVDTRVPWGELWLKWEYRETNFGWETFKDYVLYVQPKFGVHMAEGIEAYLRADMTSSGKEGPDYSFLNIADYGVGLRFVPLRSVGKSTDFFRNFKMFAEILGVSYLKDEPTNPANKVSSDVRFGVEFSYGR